MLLTQYTQNNINWKEKRLSRFEFWKFFEKSTLKTKKETKIITKRKTKHHHQVQHIFVLHLSKKLNKNKNNWNKNHKTWVYFWYSFCYCFVCCCLPALISFRFVATENIISCHKVFQVIFHIPKTLANKWMNERMCLLRGPCAKAPL